MRKKQQRQRDDINKRDDLLNIFENNNKNSKDDYQYFELNHNDNIKKFYAVAARR